MERRIVIIDAGQDLRGHSEDRVLDAQSRRDRPGLQWRVVIGGGEARKWRFTVRAEERRFGVLLPHAAIDDELGAVPQGFGEAGGGVGALLVAVIEWRIGATCGW